MSGKYRHQGKFTGVYYCLCILPSFLDSFKYSGVRPACVCSWAGIPECYVVLFAIMCISDIVLMSFWQEIRFDLGIFSKSINDECIISEFLHCLSMEMSCTFLPVALFSHLPVFFWVMSAFPYTYPWCFKCPSSDRDFTKGVGVTKSLYT